MGGGTTTSTSTPSKESQATTKFIRESVMKPLGNVLMPMMQAIMKTGGAGGGQPGMISQATGAAKGAASSAWDTIKQRLQSAGLLNTPFANRLGTETAQTGERTAAGVGPSYANYLYSIAPNMVTGTGSDIIKAQQGYGTSTSTMTPSVGSQVAGGLGSLASLAYLGMLLL